jgi:UDP-2-acetamido-3-amino-2,3-dideoxy-glucuronate N-acetyltransferase
MSESSQSSVSPFVHETAQVSPRAEIGPGTRIWHFCQVREGAALGSNCIVGKGAYIGLDVKVGDNVKIQNSCLVYHGATLENGVFLGPGVILTNDKEPRAVTSDGTLKGDADWTVGRILVCEGASVGAGSVVLPDVTIGRFAMVGAGSVVTRDVPAHGLVYGNPARLQGFVCPCGRRLDPPMVFEEAQGAYVAACHTCGMRVEIPAQAYNLLETGRDPNC